MNNGNGHRKKTNIDAAFKGNFGSKMRTHGLLIAKEALRIDQIVPESGMPFNMTENATDINDGGKRPNPDITNSSSESCSGPVLIGFR
jgi:hypothetical protein